MSSTTKRDRASRRFGIAMLGAALGIFALAGCTVDTQTQETQGARVEAKPADVSAVQPKWRGPDPGTCVCVTWPCTPCEPEPAPIPAGCGPWQTSCGSCNGVEVCADDPWSCPPMACAPSDPWPSPIWW